MRYSSAIAGLVALGAIFFVFYPKLVKKIEDARQPIHAEPPAGGSDDDVSSKVVVKTQYGRLQGEIIQAMSSPNPVYTFLGVPYAKPPVDGLRLALAEPVEPWEGDRDATQLGPGCPQNLDLFKMFVSPLVLVETPLIEDCLYLDIYSPDLNGKRNVFVFVHGGAFTMGSKQDISGAALAAEEDIVVVGINYRIGLLGFLARISGKEPWPSNLGLRDQQIALRWVQENIAVFGGDPGRVTLGGESAGAISVSAHVLSPSSRGLFHRAIVQSGSVFTTVNSAIPVEARHALDTLGCANEDPQATLVCLRGKSIPELLMAGVGCSLLGDDDVVPTDPERAYKDGKVAKVDLLIGVVQNEGDQFTPLLIPELAVPKPDAVKVKAELARTLGNHFSHNLDEIMEAVMDYYFEGDLADKEPDFVRQKFGKLAGTLLFHSPTHRAAKLHSDHVSNTYFYRFDYVGSFLRGLRPPWHSPGCDHWCDLLFTTGFPNLAHLSKDMRATEEDLVVARVALRYWANFVKTGNPNGDGLAEWKPFNRRDEHYLLIEDRCVPAERFKPDEMAFWDKIRHMDRAGRLRDEL